MTLPLHFGGDDWDELDLILTLALVVLLKVMVAP
jgi:hypothetical protein